MTLCIINPCRLDGKNVVFGEVVEGMDFVRIMDTFGNEVQTVNIIIIIIYL